MLRPVKETVVGDMRPLRSDTPPYKGLIPIPRRIHCAATTDATEDGYSEADMIIVKNFLNTLAEVALAVAVRNAQRHDEQD